MIASEKQKKKRLFSSDIYSQHFITLVEGSWVGRECSRNGLNCEGQGPAICHNKLEDNKVKGRALISMNLSPLLRERER